MSRRETTPRSRSERLQDLESDYRRNRSRMVKHVAGLLRRHGYNDAGRVSAAEDVVQEATLYVLQQAGSIYMNRALRWFANKATRTQFLTIRNTSDGKRGRVTNLFPSQIFGCRLADAFTYRGEDVLEEDQSLSEG